MGAVVVTVTVICGDQFAPEDPRLDRDLEQALLACNLSSCDVGAEVHPVHVGCDPSSELARVERSARRVLVRVQRAGSGDSLKRLEPLLHVAAARVGVHRTSSVRDLRAQEVVARARLRRVELAHAQHEAPRVLERDLGAQLRAALLAVAREEQPAEFVGRRDLRAVEPDPALALEHRVVPEHFERMERGVEANEAALPALRVQRVRWRQVVQEAVHRRKQQQRVTLRAVSDAFVYTFLYPDTTSPEVMSMPSVTAGLVHTRKTDQARSLGQQTCDGDASAGILEQGWVGEWCSRAVAVLVEHLAHELLRDLVGDELLRTQQLLADQAARELELGLVAQQHA